MRVRAAVLREGHAPFSVEELDLAGPSDHEVLVRIVAAGMCHTDLLSRELPRETFAGPQVYGHEGAGVVEAVGSAVSHVVAGDHVVLSFDSCGDCQACSARRRPHCFNPLHSPILRANELAPISSASRRLPATPWPPRTRW